MGGKRELVITQFAVMVDKSRICAASLLVLNVALAELYSRVSGSVSFATFECALGEGPEGLCLLPCRWGHLEGLLTACTPLTPCCRS